ncbi:ZIP Zinc transporter family protein [Anoxybacillus sp. B7M1]|uniref:ZIP family metal transporter n=1 Tax=unclassified Anoxybacillus TaxID=2639704 RepID=UPI0005CCBE6F|nr:MULTISPECIES: ZIP family metal transporter [unclassified Anoxybacillus]ANB56437.1 ZIP Zinc transporter family protein [Anoxybacillus sp. B2M1]ANB64737.1 ZIP Zinc transporter family protein [Anoxybacillus sp. B7M1]
MDSLGWFGFSASALGMLIGGAVAWLFCGWHKGTPIIFSLSSGMILGLAVVEILPESMAVGGWLLTVIGLAAGYGIYHHLESMWHRVVVVTNRKNHDAWIHSGVYLLFSIAIHNLPTGIALGVNAHSPLAEQLGLAMIFHNIPEGLAVFTPLLMAGMGMMGVVIGAIAVSIPVGIGALLGSLYGADISGLSAVMTTIAVGIMLTVAAKEMLGMALKETKVIHCLLLSMLGFLSVWCFLIFL